jgi:hypothetical protein
LSGTLIPDAIELVGGYLRDHADVAAIVDDRIAVELGPLHDPQIRMTLFDPVPVESRTNHLIENFLQLDCYAGQSNSSVEASLLGRTVQAALNAMRGPYDGGTVTHVEFTGGGLLPDTDVKPPRWRYIVEATVLLHP